MIASLRDIIAIFKGGILCPPATSAFQDGSKNRLSGHSASGFTTLFLHNMNDAPTPRTEQFIKLREQTAVGYEEALEDTEKFARQLERELAAERALPANLLDVHAICDQRDKAVEDLQRERALADRLAGAMFGCPSAEADNALAAWKASRDPNNLEGAGPTEDERRENARAIQAMTVPERFALMFGNQTKEEP